jgi:CRISPR-associated exonuclease Cas4
MRIEIPDYLPLSFLNQLAFCPRRFWLMYVQGEMEINAAVLEGQLRHQRAHQPGIQTDEQGRTLRSVQVWSDTLRVAGVADFVEERGGKLIPLEHKRGRIGKWLNDQIQLCAQAICLEERTGITLTYGEIYYWGSRRRERILFDDDLRQKTWATVQLAFEMLERGALPYPLDHPAKCRDCSLESICLPRETLALLKEEQR